MYLYAQLTVSGGKLIRLAWTLDRILDWALNVVKGTVLVHLWRVKTHLWSQAVAPGADSVFFFHSDHVMFNATRQYHSE